MTDQTGQKPSDKLSETSRKPAPQDASTNMVVKPPEPEPSPDPVPDPPK